MTILAFWQVGNDLGIERHELDLISHEEALKKLWDNQEELDARFYDIDSSFEYDANGLGAYFGHSEYFEIDFNDEVLDGGMWCKTLIIPRDVVREIIEASESKESDGAHFSVYVGVEEANDYYLTRSEAEEMAAYWRGEGYDDVRIVDMSKK